MPKKAKKPRKKKPVIPFSLARKERITPPPSGPTIPPGMMEEHLKEIQNKLRDIIPHAKAIGMDNVFIGGYYKDHPVFAGDFQDVSKAFFFLRWSADNVENNACKVIDEAESAHLSEQKKDTDT